MSLEEHLFYILKLFDGCNLVWCLLCCCLSLPGRSYKREFSSQCVFPGWIRNQEKYCVPSACNDGDGAVLWCKRFFMEVLYLIDVEAADSTFCSDVCLCVVMQAQERLMILLCDAVSAGSSAGSSAATCKENKRQPDHNVWLNSSCWKTK